MVSTTQLIAFIIFGVMMFLFGGVFFTFIHYRRKSDGRLVIDGDEYMVAITTKTEDLEKKRFLLLKVIVR